MVKVDELDCRLLRLPQVLEIIPVSKSAFYKGIKAKKYPQPIKISSRLAVWKLSELKVCIAELEQNCRKNADA